MGSSYVDAQDCFLLYPFDMSQCCAASDAMIAVPMLEPYLVNSTRNLRSPSGPNAVYGSHCFAHVLLNSGIELDNGAIHWRRPLYELRQCLQIFLARPGHGCLSCLLLVTSMG